MTYRKDGLIEANPDYNVFSPLMGGLKGDIYPEDTTNNDPTFGYGQFPTSTEVAIGEKVVAGIPVNGTGVMYDPGDGGVPYIVNRTFEPLNSWNQLLSDIEAVGLHTGIPLPPWLPREVTNDGINQRDLIELVGNASDLINYIAQLRNRRFNVDPANLSGLPAISSVRTEADSGENLGWFNQVIFAFDVTFASYDEARHFFNTRGRIDLVMDIEYSGTDPITLEWVKLIEDVFLDDGIGKPLKFEYARSDINETLLGFYGLEDNFNTVFFRQGGGEAYSNGYGTESFLYQAKADTADGNYVINFEAICRTGANDPIFGTMTGSAQIFKSAGVFNTVAPIINTVTELSEGGEPTVNPPGILLGNTLVTTDAACGIGSGGEECTAQNRASVALLQGIPDEYEWTISGGPEYILRDPNLANTDNFGAPTVTTSSTEILVESTSNSEDIGTYTVTCIARNNDETSNPVTSEEYRHSRSIFAIDDMIETATTSPVDLLSATPVPVESIVSVDTSGGVHPINWNVSTEEGATYSINGIVIPESTNWNGATNTDRLNIGVRSLNAEAGNTDVTVNVSAFDSATRPGDPATDSTITTHVRTPLDNINILNYNGKVLETEATTNDTFVETLFVMNAQGSDWSVLTTGAIQSGDWSAYNSLTGTWSVIDPLSNSYEARIIINTIISGGPSVSISNGYSAWTAIDGSIETKVRLSQVVGLSLTHRYSQTLQIRQVGSTGILDEATYEMTLEMPGS